jgi:alpha-tubulin suppressor-like RCC1 family protein
LNKSWYSHYQRVRLCHLPGGTGAPSDNGYTKIYSAATAFAALKADGSITAWGGSEYGGSGTPSDNGYTKIYFWYSHYQRVRLSLHHPNHPTP